MASLVRSSSSLLTGRLHLQSARCLSFKPRRLGQTSVFVQTGLKISELPMVVKKVNDILQINANPTSKPPFVNPPPPDFKLTFPRELDSETAEIIAGFNRCYSSAGIFKLLETIPSEEVSPPVAIHALRKIIELENYGPNRPQESYRGSIAGVRITDHANNNDSFMRLAFINMLLDIVYRSKSPKIILEGLQIVVHDDLPGNHTSYKERMYDETMACITEGLFNLGQVCEAIGILSRFHPTKKQNAELADILWSAILDKSDEISEKTLSAVYGTLPHLRQSRSMVLKLLEQKMENCWLKLEKRDILDILRVSQSLEIGSTRAYRILSQWLLINLHTLGEEELLAIIYCFHKLNFIDDNIITVMEKYMKIRGCQIVEKDLVAAICDYCMDFRVRSKPILEGSGEYFIEHGLNLSTPQIFSIVRLFGELDFHPPNGFKFWERLEHVLEMKFIEFPPKDVMNLMLSFIYLERYPLNFVNKLFNPYFLDRLHTQTEDDIFLSRQRLKLFDTVMKLEARSYSGPYLPSDTNYKHMKQDSRVPRMASTLIGPLADVVGDLNRIGKSVVLSSLPLNELFIVDLMIYPSVAASLLRFGFKTNNSQNVAVLVHPREHYDRTGEHLIGPQVLRRRLLKAMGFKIMELSFQDITKWRVHPKKFREYLAKEYANANKS